MKAIPILAAACIVLSSCASPSASPSGGGSAPEWAHQPARTVDSGYIVYVEYAEDPSLSQASFKAESAALQDVANECSFTPKGTRVEDRYADTAGVLHRVYAKVGVAFEDCDHALHAVEPSDIQKLANLSYTEQLRRYEDLLEDESEGEAPDTVVAENQGINPEAANAPSYPIHDTVGYFVVRQQIAYAKEVIILAPPTAYPPQAPQTVAFVSSIRPAVMRADQFAASNPQVKTWPSTWSSLPTKPAVPGMSGIVGARHSPPMLTHSGRVHAPSAHHDVQEHPHRLKPQRERPPGGKRKRRRWH